MYSTFFFYRIIWYLPNNIGKNSLYVMCWIWAVIMCLDSWKICSSSQCGFKEDNWSAIMLCWRTIIRWSVVKCMFSFALESPMDLIFFKFLFFISHSLHDFQLKYNRIIYNINYYTTNRIFKYYPWNFVEIWFSIILRIMFVRLFNVITNLQIYDNAIFIHTNLSNKIHYSLFVDFK